MSCVIGVTKNDSAGNNAIENDLILRCSQIARFKRLTNLTAFCLRS